MANFSGKILGNAVSSLGAQQAVIAATSNNIANVNTPGYSRRTVNLETRSGDLGGTGLSLGNGVNINGVTRQSDKFIERLLRGAIGDQAAAQIKSDLLGRAEELFALDGSRLTIGSAFTDFFGAVNDLAANPTSLELRANLIERATDLTESIRLTYEGIATIQDEANTRVTSEVTSINNLTAQIAQVNGLISARERGGNGEAADERDQRDQLLNSLAEKISFDVLELSDGSINVVLPGGFALVSGTTSRNLSVTTNPSFGGGTLPQSLSGNVLSYVTYDYSNGAGTADLDLTQTIMGGGGTLGALLTVRGHADPTNTTPFQATGSLVQTAAAVEGIARALLTEVNLLYLGPDADSGTANHQPSSFDLDGNNPGVYGLFDFTYSGTKDVDGDGVPEMTDDLLAIQAAGGPQSFARVLTLATTNPREIAAARDIDAVDGTTTFSAGDNTNMTALAGYRTTNITFANYVPNGITGSFSSAYSNTVTAIGNAAQRANSDLSVSDGRYLVAQGRRDEISAVSLDEEFTNLIKFQKAFQASARMIRIADEILEQIVGLI